MTNARHLAASLMMVAGPAAVWAADITVAREGDSLRLETAGPLAAWQVAPGRLALVTEGKGGLQVARLPDGWVVHGLTVTGGTGMILEGPSTANGGWNVQKTARGWQLSPGQGGGKGVRTVSATWGAKTFNWGGQPSKVVEAKSPNGQGAWRVAVVGSPLAASGAIVGAVQALANPSGGAAVAGPPAPAGNVLTTPDLWGQIAPEEGPTLTGLGHIGAHGESLAASPSGPRVSVASLPTAPRGESAATAGLTKTPVLKPSAPLPPKPAEAAGVPAGGKALGLVKMTKTKSLPAVAQPRVTTESLHQVVADIYIPGTIVQVHVPAGLKTEFLLPPPPPEAAPVSPSVEAEAATPSPTEALNTPHGEESHAEAKKDETHKPEKSEKSEKSEKTAEEKTSPTEPHVAEKVLRSPVVFPAVKGRYPEAVADLMQAVAEAPEGSRREALAHGNLVMLNLAWHRPEEALAVLEMLPRRPDGLPQDDMMRLMKGVALLATGKPASSAFFDAGKDLTPHARLWKAVATAQGGHAAEALKIWPTQRGVLPAYPDYLRAMAQKAQVQALVEAGDRTTALKTVDALVEGYGPSETVPMELVRLQGVVRLDTQKEAEGLKFIGQAAENKTDPETAARAKFDFIRALQNRHEISDNQAIDYLTRLWMEWRGDSLEEKVIKALAEVYDRQAKPREALSLWQTLVKAFPAMADMSVTTARMSETFLKAFDPENPKAYDALTYMGLYYDFRELVPNDARGDAVQEQMAMLLSNAMLYERAVPILEQQLNFRPLDSASQGRLAILLAEAYRNVGRSGEGLQLLDKWKKVCTTQALTKAWRIEEGKLLVDLNRPQAAAKSMADASVQEGDIRDVKLEADWGAQDYSASVPLLKSQLAGVRPEKLVSDTAAQLALFRLGFAYGRQGNGEALNGLTQTYGEALKTLPSLSDGLGAVAATSALSGTVPSGGPLAPISAALNDLNVLTSQVKLTREDTQKRNEDIQEFDKKMRYLELLPPPVL